MTFDTALTSANLILAAALLALFVGQHVYRTLPIFTTYQVYSIVFGFAALALSSRVSDYLLLWGVGISIDTLFYLCVLVELGKAALRHNRASPIPSGFVFLLFLAASLPIGLLARWPDLPRPEAIWQLEFRVMQASAVLEVAALLTLAWWSGLQRLRWPERELRLVMGMGTWALVQLCVLLLHEHELVGRAYHWLDLLTPVSVLGVSAYWLYSFWLEPGSTEASRNHRGAIAAGSAELRDESDSRRMYLAEREINP